MIDYTLTRSKRKTIAIYIRDDGVEVRAPTRTPQHVIDQFVTKKEKWIKEKLAIIDERTEQRGSFILNYNNYITYRGRQYPIEAKEGNHMGFDDERFYMPPGLPPERIKAACKQIYRLLAKRDLTKKTNEFAQIMSVNPASVKITDAQTRWGSCSGKKSINYSWRLIIAEDDIIDYIVVHELAHLTEMNHSARFWKVVEGVLPDYIERRSQLREFQHRLTGEDWR